MQGRLSVHRPPSQAGQSCAGFSLVEVAVLAVLLLVAIGGLSGAVLSSLRLSESSEQTARADQAAHLLAAELRAVPFEELFRRYNATPGDDPGLAGSAPGSAFDVLGLTPRSDDPDGRVGRLIFPVALDVGGNEVLDENVVDERLGMPAGLDLNGDGVLGDASADYTLLPGRVVLEWTGAGGARSYELALLLTR
jgi:hypothetical protein